ncbi:MAG: BBP7 family outer membrane beta-barrel protein [Gemmataceae bacterium]
MRNGLLSLAALLTGMIPAVAQTDAPAKSTAPRVVSPYSSISRTPDGSAIFSAADGPGGVTISPPTLPPVDAGRAAECLNGSCDKGDCCHHERVWVSAEYLGWWLRGANLPPLVTTGPALLPPACAGALVPGTTVLLGGGEQNARFFNGGRFAAGAWLGERWGVEGSYLFLGPNSSNFFASSTGAAGTAVLARPFTMSNGVPCAELVALPAGVFPTVLGGEAGSIAVTDRTFFQGAELNLVRRIGCPDRPFRLELLAGFRYLQLREQLTIVENVAVGASTTAFANTGIVVTDQFGTDNKFYGGQVGIRGEYQFDRFFVNAAGKLALGDTHETVMINGSTQFTPPAGAPFTVPGGLLALTTNSGNFSRDRFSFVNEVNVNVGYKVTPHIRVMAGYTFLYWSRVVRPGDQIDSVVNPFFVPTNLDVTAVPTPARPALTFHERSFWAQGLSVGAELRY